MNLIITEFNNGFGNTHFVRKSPDIIERVFTEKINEHMNIHVKSVKVTPVDDLHDKLSLLWDDYKVEGTITWKQSQDGKNFIFCEYR